MPLGTAMGTSFGIESSSSVPPGARLAHRYPVYYLTGDLSTSPEDLQSWQR